MVMAGLVQRNQKSREEKDAALTKAIETLTKTMSDFGEEIAVIRNDIEYRNKEIDRMSGYGERLIRIEEGFKAMDKQMTELKERQKTHSDRVETLRRLVETRLGLPPIKNDNDSIR